MTTDELNKLSALSLLICFGGSMALIFSLFIPWWALLIVNGLIVVVSVVVFGRTEEDADNS